jgi:hypothetical protein
MELPMPLDLKALIAARTPEKFELFDRHLMNSRTGS